MLTNDSVKKIFKYHQSTKKKKKKVLFHQETYAKTGHWVSHKNLLESSPQTTRDYGYLLVS